MESLDNDRDPDGIVDLHVTLNEGPPIPLSLLSDIRNRDDNTEVVIETTRMNVKLRTSGPSVTRDETDQNQTSRMYPGLSLDPR